MIDQRTADHDPDEDDDEYELEPLDEAVLAHERRLADDTVREAEARIDVDAVYRELDARPMLDEAISKFAPRFGLRTAWIALTALCLALGLIMSGAVTGRSLSVLVTLSLVGLFISHAWLDHCEETRRNAVLARRDRRLHGQPEDDADGDDTEPPSLREFLRQRARFSLKQLMIVLTVLAPVIALLSYTGSMRSASALFGLVAVAGFLAQAFDVSGPQWMMRVWWGSIAGYCVLSLLTLILGG